jgi:hypothetical protein
VCLYYSFEYLESIGVSFMQIGEEMASQWLGENVCASRSWSIFVNSPLYVGSGGRDSVHIGNV